VLAEAAIFLNISGGEPMAEQYRIIKLTMRGDNVQLKVSGCEQPLLVSQQTVAEYHLVEGVILTASLLQLLKEQSHRLFCERMAARFLAMRQHSTGELREKLLKKGFEPEVIHKVLRYYEEQGVLDDAHYAYRLAERLLEQRPCGRPYLVAYLQRRKIKRELAEQTADMVLRDNDENRLAEAALTKRWREFRQLELEVARKKSYNYLARRGFGYPAAKAAFDKLVNRKKEVFED
jgi:SOS response regulatory protein OraA/RecX